jgi:hypothetical protein
MNVISLKNHVQISAKQQQEVNAVIEKCFTLAAQRMGSMRGVLQGDVSSMVQAKTRKVA